MEMNSKWELAIAIKC